MENPLFNFLDFLGIRFETQQLLEMRAGLFRVHFLQRFDHSESHRH